VLRTAVSDHLIAALLALVSLVRLNRGLANDFVENVSDCGGALVLVSCLGTHLCAVVLDVGRGSGVWPWLDK
jgi:hypothetical protein